MAKHAWVEEFAGSVLVCDPDGIILEMNARSVASYAEDGGLGLIGKNLFNCHSEASQTTLKSMMEARTTNVYTISKKGKKKLIYQSPWYEEGEYRGFIEISVEIPEDMAHFNRG